MAYVVCQPCVNCKHSDCFAVCPVESFRDAGNMLVIHPDDCIDCGACAAECPVEAIFAEPDVPAEWAEFVVLNRRLATAGRRVPLSQG